MEGLYTMASTVVRRDDVTPLDKATAMQAVNWSSCAFPLQFSAVYCSFTHCAMQCRRLHSWCTTYY